MSFSAKLSLPARFSSHCFGSHGKTLNYFCNRLRTAKRYVTWLVSNHDRRIVSENPGVYIALRSAVTWGHTTGQTWAWSKKFYRCTNFSFHDAIIKVNCCWNNSLLIHAEGLIYQMICVQVHVNYSIFIVDCVRLAPWDKIVFWWSLCLGQDHKLYLYFQT